MTLVEVEIPARDARQGLQVSWKSLGVRRIDVSTTSSHSLRMAPSGQCNPRTIPSLTRRGHWR